MEEDRVDELNSVTFVANAIADLGGYYGEWREAVGNAHARKRAFIGRVRQQAHLISTEEGAREALIARIRKRDDVRESGRFDPDKLETAALLFIEFMGYGENTKALRSQYLSVIKAADSDPACGPSVEDFDQWVVGKGGLRRAMKLGSSAEVDAVSNDDEDADIDDAVESDDGGEKVEKSDAPSDAAKGSPKPVASDNSSEPSAEKSAREYRNEIAEQIALMKLRDAPPTPVTLDIPDDLFLDDFAVLTLEKHRDESGRIVKRLVKAVKDPATMAAIVEQAASSAKKLADLSWREAKLIHLMNMFALRKARAPHALINPNLTGDAAKPFIEAFKTLKADRVLCAKYGLAKASLATGTVYNDGAAKTFTTWSVANRAYHEWDPGRFVEGIEAGALVPYDLSDNDERSYTAMTEYLAEFEKQKIARSKKGKTGSNASESSAKSLEGYFDNGEAPAESDAPTLNADNESEVENNAEVGDHTEKGREAAADATPDPEDGENAATEVAQFEVA